MDCCCCGSVSGSNTRSGLLRALADALFSQLLLPSFSSGREEIDRDCRCRLAPFGRAMGDGSGPHPAAGFPMLQLC